MNNPRERLTSECFNSSCNSTTLYYNQYKYLYQVLWYYYNYYYIQSTLTSNFIVQSFTMKKLRIFSTYTSNFLVELSRK